MELRKAVELFLGEYKPSTRKAYSGAVLPMRDWIGPARSLGEVRPEHVLEFFQVKIDGKKYSPATRQKHLKTIKTFWNWCVRFGFIDRSPASAIRGKKPPRRYNRDRAMTDDELLDLLDFCKYKPRDYALLMFLADTGCRRAGAAGLRVSDIMWEKMRAKVTEKGEHERPVSFGNRTAQALRNWLYVRPQKHTVTGVYVFSLNGEYMNPEQISQIIRRNCHRIGLRSLGAHSLRHRKGHQFADHRIAPSIAAVALGHADVLTTMEHYYPSDYETADKALRELSQDTPPERKVVRFRQ